MKTHLAIAAIIVVVPTLTLAQEPASLEDPGVYLGLYWQRWGPHTTPGVTLIAPKTGHADGGFRTPFVNTTDLTQCGWSVTYFGGPFQLDGEPSLKGNYNFWIGDFAFSDTLTTVTGTFDTRGYEQLAILALTRQPEAAVTLTKLVITGCK